MENARRVCRAECVHASDSVRVRVYAGEYAARRDVRASLCRLAKVRLKSSANGRVKSAPCRGSTSLSRGPATPSRGHRHDDVQHAKRFV